MILILIIVLLWILFKTKNNKIRIAIVCFFIFWQGFPAYNIWQANKLVDKLCAKDGGIKIYEKVYLPKERFNQWGQFYVAPDKQYIKKNDEYFMQHETKTLKGKDDYTSLLPRVIRNHVSIFRIKDNKIMAEYISYQQGGGTALGFAIIPSGYVCPKISNFESQVFLKDNK